MLGYKQSQIQQFLYIQGQITQTVLVWSTSIIELNLDLKVIYILTKFCADWLIFVDDRVQTKSYSAIFPNSRANNSGCSGTVRPTVELIRDLMGIYILAKFGTDWSTFADARV